MQNGDEPEVEINLDASELVETDPLDHDGDGRKGGSKPKAERKKAEKTEAVGMPKRVKIWLEENDEIPPTGLPLGHNGTAYIVKPGMEVEVPEFLLEILDNAIMSAPVKNPQTQQVVDWRPRLRYPYRRLS